MVFLLGVHFHEVPLPAVKMYKRRNSPYVVSYISSYALHVEIN
jgi:hypothetical protein